jgi:TRAP-type C4-dicarboxylate transport system substrate-binding protein
MAMISSAKFSEVQDYLNLTAHVISWIYVVIGEKQFQDLPPDLQTIFLKSAKDMQRYEHQLFLRKEKLLKKELQEAGMEFIKVEQRAFQKAGSKAVYESLDDEMKKIYQQITELSED